MKNTLMSLITYLIITPFTHTALTKQRVQIKETISEITPLDIRMPELAIEVPKINIKKRDYHAFLYKLGHFESGNNYKKINTLGYLGKYQFGKSTLKTLKINTSPQEFLNNPHLQETAIWRLLKHNKRKLRRYIEKWDGKFHNGKLITESGILAAAHLSGEGNVKKFLTTGKDPKDAYGTKLSKYLYMFSGYELQLK